MTDLAALQQDFQVLLEHHRRDPDDEQLWDMFRRSREALERAWLQRLLEDA